MKLPTNSYSILTIYLVKTSLSVKDTLYTHKGYSMRKGGDYNE